MNPHASLRCLLCSEWVEWDDASCLSLPLASSPCFLSCRFLSTHSSARMHALMRRLLLCTHTYAHTPMHPHACLSPCRLACSLHCHSAAAAFFLVFIFLFLLLWAAAGCGVGASRSSCLFLLPPLLPYTTSSPEHLEPPAPYLTSLLLSYVRIHVLLYTWRLG